MSPGDVLFVTIAVILMALEPFLCSAVNRLVKWLCKRYRQVMVGDTSGTAAAIESLERLEKGEYVQK